MAMNAAAGPDQAAVKDTAASPPGGRQRAQVGRKRDAARDSVILEAALAVLAEQGYDGMTIDMVAAEAGMARATVYRRWATKADLVLEAVSRMSRSDVGLAQLPDTGSLRGDLTAMILPLDDAQQQVRIQAMAGLLSLAKADQRLPQQSRDVTERMSRPQAAGRVPRRSRAVCPHPPGR
jgi:AcrR family transcriptional regulator